MVLDIFKNKKPSISNVKLLATTSKKASGIDTSIVSVGAGPKISSIKTLPSTLGITSNIGIAKSTPSIVGKKDVLEEKAMVFEVGEGFKNFGLPEEQIEVMKSKTQEKIASLSEKRFKDISDRIEEFKDRPTEIAPFLSSITEGKELYDLWQTAQKIQNNEKVTSEELVNLQAYVEKSDQIPTFGYKVLDTVINMVPFFGELFATRGVYTATKAGAIKGTKELLSKFLKKGGKELLEKRLSKVGLEVAGTIAGGTAQTIPAGITRIGAGTIEKQLQSTLTGDEESIWNSLVKATGEQWVETVSERSGGLITGLTNPIKGKLSKLAIFKAFQKVNPGKDVNSINKVISAMGYNGVIEEMFEERVADVAHGILNKAGISDQEFSIPSLEDLAVELVSFAVPGAAFQVYKSTPLKLTPPGGTIEFVGEDGKKPSISQVKPLTKATPQATAKAGFYVNEFDATGNLRFVPAEKANIVEISPEIETFISKGRVSGWRISESKTGTFIAEGKTQKEAIQKASEIIENHKNDIETSINKAIERGGVSPRYSGSQAQKGVSGAIKAEKGIIPKETKTLEWARGTRAAGIQNTGLKNYNEATRVLEKAGEIPTEIKTKNVTKDFIQNYYETKKSPVVGDVFINAKGERIEIIKIKDNAVDYFLKGKKKGIQGTVYTDKGFIEKIERITPKAIPKELEPLAAEARKYKSAEEFIKSPKYEYHLSNSADLVEGKTFSEQIGKVPTARRGIVGGADDAVFTTNNPQFWDSQLSKELGKDAPSNIYLVEVKNPSPRGMLESGFDAQASNLSKDVRIIKNLGKTGEGILDIGNIEFKKNQILTDIYTQATKGVARGGGEITPLQKVQSRFETILSNQKEKFNIKPASIESLSKKYKSVIPDAELVKYEQGYAEKRASTFRGEIDNLIKNLRESGVRDDVIKNTKIEGVPLDEIVRVKREINGSVSAIITKSDLDDIRLTFNGEIPTDKWVKRISVSEAKRGAGRLARLYEIPRLTFERWGLGDAVYQPIRQAERQANNMYVGFLKRFEDAGLFKRGGWVTADRFTISKPEAENIGKYYLTRQNKGYKVSFSDLSVKEKKFVEIFDGIIKETEDEFYRIAKLNGKDPGVIKNYAPLMTSGDIKIIDQVGDFDFIFRKHPAFFSLKERAKDVPVGLYELDYREIASRWLDGISKFNSLGEITPKIKYLTQSEEFKGIVGSEIANATTYWLKQTLNPSITKEVYQSVNYLARFLRKASATASLGLNYASVVKQTLTQIPLTIIEKAPPKLKSKFAKDFGINVADLASLRERKGTVAIADMQGKIGRIFTGSLTEFDRLNAQTSLNALLDKNYAKVLKGGEEITQDTVNYILQVSQDTLDMWYGGMTKSQLPTAFRSEVGKMINMFLLPLTSQLNGFFSRVLLAKGLGGKTKATAEVLSAAVVIAYLEQVISNLSPNWGDEKAMTKDVLVSLTGNIPIASQIAWSISTQDDIQITAGVSGISALAKELGKDDKEILTVALKASEALGLPKMVRRLIEGGEIISEGGVYDKNGKLLFEVEEMPEQIRTILRGKYGSLAGQEYIEGIGKKNEVIPTGTKNNIKMKGMNNIKMPGMRVPQMPNINKIMPKI